MLKLVRWPFKSAGNFFITSIGFVGFSFWGYSIYSQTKFNQPIIGESIKQLGKHQQVKQLVGFPLSYSFSIGNRFVQKDNEAYYSFKVNGPKNSINVEMTAGSSTADQLYRYDDHQPDPKIVVLKNKIRQQQEGIDRLELERKKTNSKRMKEIQLEKASLQSQIKALNIELLQHEYDLIEKRQRFYVPSKQLYTRINHLLSKDSDESIPKDQRLWGINDLVITLPNRTKMIVYPQPKKTHQQKEHIISETPLNQTLTVGLLNKRVSIDVSNLTKEEVQQYGSQKTNFMYSKYSSIRMFSGVIFIGAIAGIMMYRQKNILRNIKGSILEQEIRKMLSKNQKVIQILKQKNQQFLQFDNLIGGGIANNQFKCVMYISNLTNGRLQFQGKYAEDMNAYEYRKLLLKFRDKDQKREINLLL